MSRYLIFSLLEREFALKAECIQGVERLGMSPLFPNVAPWVRGVINLRGSIASVVDYAHLSVWSGFRIILARACYRVQTMKW